MVKSRASYCSLIFTYFFAGAVAKYCDEYVYVCLSVREDISGSTCAMFTKYFVYAAYGRGSVLPFQLRHRRNAKGKGAILWGFFPTDNALYGIAFGTHTKTAEPI